ncbi:MAG: DUF3857 domain-containing protein [Alphaproteobacteria bacterium]
MFYRKCIMRGSQIKTRGSLVLYKFLFIKLFLFVLLIDNAANARWATHSDMPIEVEFRNEDIKVNANGTSTSTIEVRKKILKEGGRACVANYTLFYNGDSSKVTIVEAKTIYQGKEYKLSKKMIEDQPLASAPHGFDQQRQILLSFPHAEIGATIYLKYIKKETKPILDNFFSKKFYYGRGEYLSNCHIKLQSKLPLHIKVNDQEGILKITKDTEDNFHSLTIDLSKPICKAVINEPGTATLDPKHGTWVSISSINNWEELATILAKGYVRVLKQALPAIFEEILTSAKSKKTEIEQINTVTSLLNEKIQYMGDWRSVAGRFFPRDLKEIASSQVGDCKDFSISTAAILKELGYEVHNAIVLRGATELSLLGGLPDIGDFNHAFLKVTGKQGAVYWIDPTNRTSMAQGIFPDIANKMTLILSPDKPSYEKVASINPEHAGFTYTGELEINGNTVSESGVVTLVGEEAIEFTGLASYISEQQIKDLVFYALSGTHLEEQNKKEMVLPDLTARIVEDLTLRYKYDQDNRVIKTNLGPGIRIKSMWADSIINTAPDQVSELFIGTPCTVKNKTIIKIRVPNIENLNYEINTPWFSIKRSCVYNGETTEINDTVCVKQSFITNEDLKTPLYKDLKHNLEQHFKGAIVVLGDISQPQADSKKKLA